MSNELRAIDTSEQQSDSYGWVEGFEMTKNALLRMRARRIPYEGVAATIAYGRAVETPRATVFALGRKDIRRHDTPYVNLRRYEGIQVVCVNNKVVTVYRDRDLSALRQLKDHRRSSRMWRA